MSFKRWAFCRQMSMQEFENDNTTEVVLNTGVKKLFEFENFVIIGFTDHDTAVTAKTGLLELADALVHLGQVSLDIFTRAPQETRREVSRYLET